MVYNYDSNGNMTEDKNRGITGIGYDINNRPLTVDFGGATLQRTRYVYDASGRKLRTEYQINRFALGVPGGKIEIRDSLSILPGLGGGSVAKPLAASSAVGSVSGIGGIGDIGGVVKDPVSILDPWQTSYRRDYCGDIVYKDGEIERILTDNQFGLWVLR